MRAPWSAAQTMPAATSTSLPEPVESSTLTGRIDASGATPDSARPLPRPPPPCPRRACRGRCRRPHRRCAAMRVPAGQQAAGEIGRRGHARVDDCDDDAGAAGHAPGRGGADGVEAPLLRATRVGREARAPADGAAARRSGRPASAAAPAGPSSCAPARHARRRRAGAGRRAPARRPQRSRARRERSRPQPDHDRVGRVRRPWSEQGDQSREDGQEAAEMGWERHVASLAGVGVTAHAPAVPDV